MIVTLENLIPLCRQRVENFFAQCIKKPKTPAPNLQEAMSYAIYNGGKRIRPLLVYATGLASGAELEKLDPAAAAVELIHSYSLIHDDLPAMDNADLRRGQPSCHKKFGEAMAILAGDALQTLAFQVIADADPLSPEQKIKIINALGQASGFVGMAGGQALDITNTQNNVDPEELLLLYKLKTGALLTASIQLGAISAHVTDITLLKRLETFGDCLGLAFQLQDDLLDIEGSSTSIGKPAHLDQVNNKMTYPTLYGIENTKRKIQELTQEAIEAIEIMGKKSLLLKELANHLLKRST